LPLTQASPATATVRVESLGGLGDGIARLNGKPVFIPKSIPGDELLVRIIHENRDGLQAQIETILTPGPHRIIPPCGYYDICGGCSLQHFSDPYYRDFKTRVLRNSITHAGYSNIPSEVTFISPSTRRRVEFKIDHSGAQPALAYHAPKSHTPVTIKNCLILTPELQSLIGPLNHALSQWQFTPTLYALSLTAADSGIDMLLTVRGELIPPMPDMKPWCETLGINRISIRTREGKPEILAQIKAVEMNLGGYSIPLPPDAFLQATAQGQELLTEAALEACDGNQDVADLFCGIGTYSFAASKLANVHAIEGDAGMVRAMQSSVKTNAIAALHASQRDLFKNPLKPSELSRFNAVIINPPRLGAKAQCEELARSQIKTITMISCNPATFARDAKILKTAGFDLVSASGIDQFVFSQHLEVVAQFRR